MKKTTVALSYGHSHLELDLPTDKLMGVIEPKFQPTPADEDGLLAAALAHPVKSRPLRELVRPGEKIAIVTSDLTRPCPSARILPHLVSELEAAGVRDQDVFIVLGLGLHRAMTAEELEIAVGAEMLRRFRVVNHDAKDVVSLGHTSLGTPVEFYRPLVVADRRVTLGVIEYHYFAGYSGGAKAIFPGCASQAAVTANHAMMTLPEARGGKIEGNPVRMDIEEAVAMLGVDFMLNVVVDGEHRIVGAFAGDLTAAHRKGCEMVAERGKVKIPRLADIVIASAGGYPKDVNIYQAHKALESASNFIRDGGVIILAAECSEGFGNQTFEAWMCNSGSPTKILDRIRQQFIMGGHKAAAIARLLLRTKIYLVSNLEAIQMSQTGLVTFASLQAAWEAAVTELGPESVALVLPHATSIWPDIDPVVELV